MGGRNRDVLQGSGSAPISSRAADAAGGGPMTRFALLGSRGAPGYLVEGTARGTPFTVRPTADTEALFVGIVLLIG